MAPPTTTTSPPTKAELEAALALVLDNSATATEAAARVGVSYMAFRRKGVPVFRVGREQRIWLDDLSGVKLPRSIKSVKRRLNAGSRPRRR